MDQGNPNIGRVPKRSAAGYAACAARSACPRSNNQGTAMPRALWKGAISFGLVHVPVALYPAARQDELGFDMLDKRDMARIGYKRYNKETGKEIERENIVKGLEYESG